MKSAQLKNEKSLDLDDKITITLNTLENVNDYSEDHEAYASFPGNFNELQKVIKSLNGKKLSPIRVLVLIAVFTKNIMRSPSEISCEVIDLKLNELFSEYYKITDPQGENILHYLCRFDSEQFYHYLYSKKLASVKPNKNGLLPWHLLFISRNYQSLRWNEEGKSAYLPQSKQDINFGFTIDSNPKPQARNLLQTLFLINRGKNPVSAIARYLRFLGKKGTVLADPDVALQVYTTTIGACFEEQYQNIDWFLVIFKELHPKHIGNLVQEVLNNLVLSIAIKNSNQNMDNALIKYFLLVVIELSRFVCANSDPEGLKIYQIKELLTTLIACLLGENFHMLYDDADNISLMLSAFSLFLVDGLKNQALAQDLMLQILTKMNEHKEKDIVFHRILQNKVLQNCIAVLFLGVWGSPVSEIRSRCISHFFKLCNSISPSVVDELCARFVDDVSQAAALMTSGLILGNACFEKILTPPENFTKNFKLLCVELKSQQHLLQRKNLCEWLAFHLSTFNPNPVLDFPQDASDEKLVNSFKVNQGLTEEYRKDNQDLTDLVFAAMFCSQVDNERLANHIQHILFGYSGFLNSFSEKELLQRVFLFLEIFLELNLDALKGGESYENLEILEVFLSLVGVEALISNAVKNIIDATSEARLLLTEQNTLIQKFRIVQLQKAQVDLKALKDHVIPMLQTDLLSRRALTNQEEPQITPNKLYLELLKSNLIPVFESMKVVNQCFLAFMAKITSPHTLAKTKANQPEASSSKKKITSIFFLDNDSSASRVDDYDVLPNSFP